MFIRAVKVMFSQADESRILVRRRNTGIWISREKEARISSEETFTSITRCFVKSALKTILFYNILSLQNENHLRKKKKKKDDVQERSAGPCTLKFNPFVHSSTKLTHTHINQYACKPDCAQRKITHFLSQAKNPQLGKYHTFTLGHWNKVHLHMLHFVLKNVTAWSSRRVQFKDGVATIVAPFWTIWAECRKQHLNRV